MMMVTFNCEWTTPEEQPEAIEMCENRHDLNGISAIIGTDWKPLCPANDNVPSWLEIYG